jgi:N-glycosylase/DNA lyase
MCIRFGKKIAILDDTEFYEFPTLDEITATDKTESILRELGFGYRAKYIANTCLKIKAEHPQKEKWLNTLRNVPYQEAKSSLMTLQGVGPKVADCVVSFILWLCFICRGIFTHFNSVSCHWIRLNQYQ